MHVAKLNNFSIAIVIYIYLSVRGTLWYGVDGIFVFHLYFE